LFEQEKGQITFVSHKCFFWAFFVLFAAVRAGPKITNVTDCSAVVWPSQAPLPAWLNQSSVLVARDLQTALRAVALNVTHPVVCFTDTDLGTSDLFPVPNNIGPKHGDCEGRYLNASASFDSLTLAGLFSPGRQSRSVLIDPNLDFFCTEFVGPNITRLLTVQDVTMITVEGWSSLATDFRFVEYKGLNLQWRGNVVLDQTTSSPSKMRMLVR
jgi:hypothetical protein